MLLYLCLLYERVQPVNTRVVPLVGKTSKFEYIVLNTPKLGPKKTVWARAFRVVFTLDWSGFQLTFF